MSAKVTIYAVESIWRADAPNDLRIAGYGAEAKPKTYRLADRHAAFGYSITIHKSAADLSPEAAVARYVDEKDGEIEHLEKDLAEAKRLRALALTLVESEDG